MTPGKIQVEPAKLPQGGPRQGKTSGAERWNQPGPRLGVERRAKMPKRELMGETEMLRMLRQVVAETWED